MYSADLLINLSFPLVGNPSDSTLAKASGCCIRRKIPVKPEWQTWRLCLCSKIF